MIFNNHSFALYTEYFNSLVDSINVCQFVFGPSWQLMGMGELAEMVSAVTGWEVTVDELMEVGRRRLNMLRAFNAREGITRDADTLPDRFNDFQDEDWLLGIGYSRDATLRRGWSFGAGVRMAAAETVTTTSLDALRTYSRALNSELRGDAPAAIDQLEEAIGHVIHKLRTMGEREVSSRLVGELVMQELHDLDEVAYVRFASVYRRFQDITEFEEEIKRLQRISETAASREQMSLLPDLLGKKKS